MKKYLHKLTDWLKRAFRKEQIEKEIPLEEAFRMWKEQQRKKNGS